MIGSIEWVTSVYHDRTVVWCALFSEQSKTSDLFACESMPLPAVPDCARVGVSHGRGVDVPLLEGDRGRGLGREGESGDGEEEELGEGDHGSSALYW